MHVTPDDVVLFQLVRQHRLMTSQQLYAAAGGDRNLRAFTHRLALLFHAGYLDRPRLQVRPGEPARPFVYALGQRGWDTLDVEDGVARRSRRDRRMENQRLKPMAIDHDVAVTETVLAFQLAAIRRGWSCTATNGDAFRRQSGLPRRVKIRSRDDVAGTLPLNPDAYLRLTDKAGVTRSYFLEVDLATEPQVRRSLRVSSILQKLYAYWEVFRWQHGFAQNALFVTTTPTRLENMIAVARAMDPKGAGSAFFHFALLADCTLADPDRVLDGHVWRSAHVAHANPRALLLPSCEGCGGFVDPANDPHVIVNSGTPLTLAPASTLLPDLLPDDRPRYAHVRCNTKQPPEVKTWPAQ